MDFQLAACRADIVTVVTISNEPDASADGMVVDDPRDASGLDQDSGDRTADRRADAPTAGSILATRSSTCNVCNYLNCWNLSTACDAIVGDAAAGPAAGTPKSELCGETLECVLSTGCRDFATCYCGQPAEQPNGRCLDALQRSVETTVMTEAFASSSDYSKGGAWAMMLVQCLSSYCPSCFDVPPTDAGGAADSSSIGPGGGGPAGQPLNRCELAGM